MGEIGDEELRKIREIVEADRERYEQRARELSRPGYRVTVIGLHEYGDELPAEWADV